MLTHIKLQFNSDDFVEIADEDLYSYEKNEEITGVDAQANTSAMSISFLKDFFPSLSTLMLTNSKLDSIKDIGYNYNHLTILSLTYCGLTTLTGISQISLQLEELYLAHNKLVDISDLIGMNDLYILDLEDNCIESIDDLECLSQCNKLEVLTFRDNPAAIGDDYRARVRYILPDLKYLDEVKFLAHETRSKLSNSRNSNYESDNDEDDSLVNNVDESSQSDAFDLDDDSDPNDPSSKPFTAPVTFEKNETKGVLLKDMYSLKPMSLNRKTKTPVNAYQQAVIKKPVLAPRKQGVAKVPVLGKLKPMHR